MKQFDVHSHPTLGLEAMKNGISWPGFFFTRLWMLICRMWIGGIVVLAILLAIGWVVVPLAANANVVASFMAAAAASP